MLRKIIVLALLTAVIGCQPVFGSITETTNREPLFTGDDLTVAFVFSFPIETGSSGSHADLEVHLITTATGNSVEQTETTHYAVSATNNNFSSGGTVTMVTAPATTETLLIIRSTPQTQQASIGTSGVRLTIQDAIDKLTKEIIDLQESDNRSLKFPKTDSTSITSEISNSVSRASTILGFTSTGAPVAFSSFTPGTVAVDPFMEDYLAKSSANAANTFMGLGTGDSPTWAGAAITGALTVGTTLGVTGVATFSDDVGMATGKTLTVETVQAVDGDGLSLFEDGGTGIFIADGGNVGVGASASEAKMTVTLGGTVPALGTPPAAQTVLLLNSTAASNSSTRIVMVAGSTGSTGGVHINMGDADDLDIGGILYDNNADSFALRANNSIGLLLDSGGDVGIGNATPTYRLDVADDVTGFAGRFVNDGDNADRQVLLLQGGPDDGSTGNWDIVEFNDGDATGIGGIRHPTGGGALAFFDTSDEDLKNNLRDTKIKGTNTIKALKVRDYEWKDSGDTVIGGFSAQEVYAVCPAAAVPPDPSDPDSVWTMSQSQFIPYLVKANQELTARVEVLEAGP